MKMPTHIVIDTDDGWVFWNDGDNHLFTERTAKATAARYNRESLTRSTYIVAAVVPVMSPELMTAIIKDGQETPPQLEAGSPMVRCEDLFTEDEMKELGPMKSAKSYYTPERANEIRAQYGLPPREWGIK